MSILKLSHTSKELYLKSPRAYFYHYHLYLREKTLGSPLFFGSLIEKGLDVLFKGGTLEQAKETFIKNFKVYTINGNVENLSSSKFIRYSKADLDLDVFTEKEIADLSNKSTQFKSWASLQRKGEMMIEAYYRDIFPKIKKVVATQKYFSIDNGAGDEITGFADLICEWEDGRLIIPDHKTSANPYPDDAVLTEQYGKQTALYFEAFKDEYPLDGTGFFVLEKKMRKKEPKARTQVILDKPPEELVEKTLDEFDSVLYDIKQGKFPCASPKCDAYGQQCCYKKYCQSGGADLTGLVKIGKQK
jgi:hypothetical protein